MRPGHRSITALNVVGLVAALGSGAFVARLGGTSRAEAGAREAERAPDVVVDSMGVAVPVRRYTRILAGSHVADHLVTSLCEREWILAVSGNGLPGAIDPERFAGIPDVRYTDDSHFVAGDRGLSEWLLSGTSVDGERIEVRGCDIWTFEGDMISAKRSFWKIRTP